MATPPHQPQQYAAWRYSRHLGRYASPAELPNVAGSSTQNGLLDSLDYRGAIAYSLLDASLYVLVDPTEGAAVWFPFAGPSAIVGKSFGADQFDNPVNADWAVNALAPAAADSNNAGLTVRLFDDTTEEGVGFQLDIPSGATGINFDFKSRAETAPGSPEGVVPRLYFREIPDNAAVAAWSAGLDLLTIDIPTNEFFQYDNVQVTLATLGLSTDVLAQFELTRNTGSGSDTLTGDWDLIELQTSFF